MLDTLGLFLNHMQHNSFLECQVPKVDTAGVTSSIKLLHSIEHDGAIIAGEVPNEGYTVLETAPILEVPHRYTKFGVIVQHNLLLEGKGKMYEIARTGV